MWNELKPLVIGLLLFIVLVSSTLFSISCSNKRIERSRKQQVPQITFDQIYKLEILDGHEVLMTFKKDSIHIYYENAYKLSGEVEKGVYIYSNFKK